MDTSNFPVESVSWENAVEFCKKLSAMEGRTYRLPSEAEWEYACRAGSTTWYCFGDDMSKLDEYAWFGERFLGDVSRIGQPHGVGQKKPNAWGLYDMHGNVWEYCQDWYDEEYYARSPVDDPPGAKVGTKRVYRGGAWRFSAWDCRSAERRGELPTQGEGHIDRGFRVVLVPSDERNRPETGQKSKVPPTSP